MTPRFPLPSIGRGLVSVGRAVGPAVDTTTPPVTDQLTAHYAARLESFADGDAVGTLTDQQNANDLTQSTSSKKPTFRDNATDNIGGLPVIDFDGSDDLLTASNFLSATQGEVVSVFRIRSVADAFVSLFAHNNTTVADENITVRIHNNDGSGNEANIGFTSTDTDRVAGNTTITSGLFIINWSSDGTSYSIHVDGSAETIEVEVGSDSGNWWGDVSSPDTAILGASETSSGEIEHSPVDLGEHLLYSKQLSSTERSDLWDWLNNTVGYGIF